MTPAGVEYIDHLAALVDGTVTPDRRQIIVGNGENKHRIRVTLRGQVVVATLPDAAPLGAWNDPEACAAAWRDLRDAHDDSHADGFDYDVALPDDSAAAERMYERHLDRMGGSAA